MGVHEELKNLPNTLNLNQIILPESTSPKTLLPQLHLLPHDAPTIDATHCQVAGDAASNGAGLHHRSSSDGGFASLKCAEHHNMASMFASLFRLVNIVLLRYYQAITVDIHHQNVPPKSINSTTPHITVTPFLSIQTPSFPVEFQFWLWFINFKVGDESNITKITCYAQIFFVPLCLFFNYRCRWIVGYTPLNLFSGLWLSIELKWRWVN